MIVIPSDTITFTLGTWEAFEYWYSRDAENDNVTDSLSNAWEELEAVAPPAQPVSQPPAVVPITCQIYGHVVGHCADCNVGLEPPAVQGVPQVQESDVCKTCGGTRVDPGGLKWGCRTCCGYAPPAQSASQEPVAYLWVHHTSTGIGTTDAAKKLPRGRYDLFASQPPAVQGHLTTPNTYSGFQASFYVEHERNPTQQEVFNAGVRSGQKLAAVQEGPAGWISVEERVPEIDYNGPAYLRSVRVLTAAGSEQNKIREMSYKSNAYAKTEKGRLARFEWQGSPSYTVTHWMPLPAAPQLSVSEEERIDKLGEQND